MSIDYLGIQFYIHVLIFIWLAAVLQQSDGDNAGQREEESRMKTQNQSCSSEMKLIQQGNLRKCIYKFQKQTALLFHLQRDQLGKLCVWGHFMCRAIFGAESGEISCFALCTSLGPFRTTEICRASLKGVPFLASHGVT